MADDEALARELGVLEATSIGIGTMIGGGIFILSSIAAAQAGPASAISFALTGAITLLAALSHAELATAMPTEGGSYVYVDRALGRLAGSVVGWGIWAGTAFSTAFYALGFGEYLQFFVDLPVGAAALVVVAALIGLNYYGAAEVGELETLLVVALLVLILGFVGFGLPAVDAERLRPFNPHGWGAVFSTVGTLYVTFVGFTVVATAAGEVRDPARNLPISMVASVLVPTVLYVLVMVVSTGVLPADALTQSDVPVAAVARRYLGRPGELAMVVGALLATVSSANAAILQASRVSFAMGDRRTLSRWLTQTHDRFGTPYRSVVVTGVCIAALLGAGANIDLLAEVAGVIYFVSFAIAHLALVRLRRDDRFDYDPGFEIPSALYPWVPAVGFLSIVAVLTQVTPLVLGITAAVVLAAGGWYAAYVRREE